MNFPLEIGNGGAYTRGAKPWKSTPSGTISLGILYVLVQKAPPLV